MIRAILTTGLLLAVAAPASAAPLRVGFLATVTAVEGTPPTSVPATLSGSFPFLPMAVDQLDGNPDIGLYAPNFFAPEGRIEIDLGGTPLGFGVLPTFFVLDGVYDDADAGVAGGDAFRVQGSLASSQPGGATLETIDLRLVDPDGSALADVGFPPMPPDLDAFALRTIEIRLERCTDPFDPRCEAPETEFAIHGTLDAVWLVPEPGTARLVGVLGLGAGALRRRRGGASGATARAVPPRLGRGPGVRTWAQPRHG